MATTLDFLQSAYNSIFIAPESYDEIGSAFQFDIVNEDKLHLSSNSTNYLLEDGSTVQDNVTLNPVQISLRGFVGEVTVRAPQRVRGTDFLQSKLNQLAGVVPGLATSAQQYLDKATQTAKQLTDIVDKAGNAYNLVNNFFQGSQSTKQSTAAQRLYTFWRSKTPFDVRTPFQSFKNCILEDVQIIQGDNKYVSDIQVELKSLEFVDPAVSIVAAAGRRALQASSSMNLGKDNGVLASQAKIFAKKFF